MLLSWLPLAWAPHSLAALIIGILALDLAVQALHVTNQSLILQSGLQHSRLIGAYMMFYAAGSGAGALAPPMCTPWRAGPACACSAAA
jgi:hypothetical protein